MTVEVSPEVKASFRKAIDTGVIPEFEGKGLYVTRDKANNRTGFSDSPQHPGQMPNTYPPEWPPLFCATMSRRDQAIKNERNHDSTVI